MENNLNINLDNINYSLNNNISSNIPNSNINSHNSYSLPQNQMISNEQNNIITPNNIPFHDYRYEKNILYISDLPYNTNDTDLKYFFKRYGDNVSYISINHRFHIDDTRPINAKVIFKDYNTANQARLDMNLRKLKGHAIRLMWEERDNSIRSNSKTNLFVKGIPFNVQPREVYEYFMKFGDISSAKLKDDADGNHLGYGYVTYYKPESAENAIKNSNGKIIWGNIPLQVDYFKKKNERISTSGPEVPKLYITNFPGDFTNNNIIDLTKEFGAIISCSIKTEKIGRRFALVCYENEESAKKALAALDGKNILGYNLFCKIIKDKNFPEELQLNKIQNNNLNKRFFQRNTPGFLNNNNNMCNLIIKEIPYTIKEKEFKEIFAKYGNIVSSKLETYNLITNIGGQTVATPTSKGFGYVCYEDQEVAKKVKDELDGKYLPGYGYWKNPLKIDYFLSKSQKEMNDMKINNNQNNYNHNYYNNPNMYMQPIQPQFVQNNYKNPFSGFDFNKFNSLFDEKAKKEYLGEIIYSQIYNGTLINDMPNKDQVVAKITGMILDIENIDEIMKISIDNDLLTKNVIDALNLLKNSNYDFNS
jgi:RNA recognition motif-containing protein